MRGHGSQWSSVAQLGTALCCCGLLLAMGCKGPSRGKQVPVQGKVTLDGKPLTGGGVIFHPIPEKDTPMTPIGLLPSMGPIQDDGSYTLRTEGRAGVPLGKYRVQLDMGSKADKKQWSLLAPVYMTLQSPLVIEVVEGKPEGGYDLNLSSRMQPGVNPQGTKVNPRSTDPRPLSLRRRK